MQKDSRNRIVSNGRVLSDFEDYHLLNDFDCGDADLNEYFRKDTSPHNNELLSKTYSLIADGDELPFPVALIDLGVFHLG